MRPFRFVSVLTSMTPPRFSWLRQKYTKYRRKTGTSQKTYRGRNDGTGSRVKEVGLPHVWCIISHGKEGRHPRRPSFLPADRVEVDVAGERAGGTAELDV